jgi:hypothetical protein
LCVCWEIDKDGCGHISWQFDHGKRKGSEHFLKVISWGGINELGDKVIKSYCIDSNCCSHSAKESAKSIKEMGDLIHLLVPYIIYSSATSDSGGGGAIQNVYPKLLKLGMFDAEQSPINYCELHAMNKPLENALKKALGDSGIGHNSPWQLLYLSDIFLDQLVAELGLKRVNEIWAEINAQLFTDPCFQQECYKHGGLTFDQFYNAIQTESDEDPDKLNKKLFTCPTNGKDSVFSRWLTLLLANDVFLEHYFTLYLLAIWVKTQFTSKSLAHTYACNMLALMRIKRKADYTDRDDDFPPVFYTVLLFVQGFSRAFFLDHFNWTMRSNPNFGDNSYGFLSPYCPEHAYVATKATHTLLDI